jgi:hypothetical protein
MFAERMKLFVNSRLLGLLLVFCIVCFMLSVWVQWDAFATKATSMVGNQLLGLPLTSRRSKPLGSKEARRIFY